MLKYIWIATHILTIGYLSRFKFIISLLILFSLLVLYWNVGLVGDIQHAYIFDIKDIYDSRFEVGFKFLINIIYNLGFTNVEAMYILQIVMFLSIVLLVILNFSRNKKIFVLSFFLLSVYFFLGIENAFRQGFAIVFLLFFIIYLLKGKYFFALLYLLIAESLHMSSFVFAVIIFFCWYIFKYIYHTNQPYYNLSKYKFFLFTFAILLVSYIFVLILEPYIIVFATRNNDRLSGILKPLLVLLTFIISNYFWIGKSFILRSDLFFLYLRSVFFGLFFAFSLINGGIEIASRILLFYFALEIFLSAQMFQYRTRQKVGSVFILLSYSFAINVFELLAQSELGG